MRIAGDGHVNDFDSAEGHPKVDSVPTAITSAIPIQWDLRKVFVATGCMGTIQNQYHAFFLQAKILTNGLFCHF